ncbi:hypothetical protein [Sinorhizobium sp. BG8]|uniref:hypothetical protein n=1 Tax=Sinorhizobium sp. BG8 TaxID=2613773 RepID=UPI00193CBF71|nr:hypothetical protein [Sinorhizobium sp. BG8]QRM55306.1 hypothetical protein F3Y30_12755 [Sinorhizobium sp. BG8]
MTTKITITPLKPDRRGQPYAVSLQGQTIIPKSHVPSHDACRYLTERGFSGAVEVWSDGEAKPRLLIADLQKAAKFTVSEDQNRGPRVVRYQPMSIEARQRLRASQRPAVEETRAAG